ncbi:prolipoprotein diacylglyceryl transferase family protein [Geobacter pickeringii]|uniref:Prolipoprotein diacylglyceryl transferase n=1 Tax=Geobacter pickeringii TaxID=345632 RepID=A0A0B5BGF8_9BACT|nr:prolipoprotein diacylglyceryl transferase family protein [Geobacter pickeringii]AJE03126.1 prolipoprotein diacylglyceryl transferase [Geobacter pickeringii]
MTTLSFISIVALAIILYFWWGFTVLPDEQWQILATVPVAKAAPESWRGVNLTWYGLLTANAYAAAVAIFFILLGAIRVTPTGVAILAVALLLVCVPASRLVARIVEKKSHTFTVGGAVFVGIVIAPWLIPLVNRTAGVALGFYLPPLATLAAIAIAYSFGEGLGRMACISFGCCYGKPLQDAPSLLRRIFAGSCFIFSGGTKKIAYAHGLEGVRVLPVQAITAVLYAACGLFATVLFLEGKTAIAFITATAVTQAWRFLSETLRADYRGEGRISPYQIMGVLGILYAGVGAFLLRGESARGADLTAALSALWDPAMILFLQALWLAIFCYTGRSTVTGATLTFHVHRERV